MSVFFLPPRYVPKALHQWGQGTVEFLVSTLPVVLLGFASIEAIHWNFVRQAASLALTQAARAASTRNGDPFALDAAFFEAMLPLHAASTPHETRSRLERAMAKRSAGTQLPAWRIHILSPSRASFQDFASHSPDLPRHGARAVIDNDYLHEQHQARVAAGNPHGRGSASGQTVLEANTLVLELTWLHEPLLPGTRKLLQLVAPTDTRYGSLAMARGGFLPLRRMASVVMQSHAVAFDMPGHGRIVREGESGVSMPLAPGGYGGQGAVPPETAAPVPGEAVKSANPPMSEMPAPWGPGDASSSPVYREPGRGAALPADGAGATAPDDCPGCCD